MPVYHIVLFKLKPTVTAEQITHLSTAAQLMVGKIPGLTKMDVGPPLPATAHRSQGYDMALVAVLEGAEHVEGYGKHPAHDDVHRLREELCTETLAYDLVF